MINFLDATELSLISEIVNKEPYGVSWGRLNNDDYPDLYINDHNKGPSQVWVNQKDGTFADDNQSFPLGDPHGAGWFDFDNDGDDDLFELVGLTSDNPVVSANRFFLNDNGLLVDQAQLVGLEHTEARGRTPTVFDYDKDGLLDIFANNQYEIQPNGVVKGVLPTTVFRQKPDNTFEDVGAQLGFGDPFSLLQNQFGILSDLSGDDVLDLVLFPGKEGVPRVYDTTSEPFREIGSELFSNISLPSFGRKLDAFSGDLNGDLIPDLVFSGTQFRTTFETVLLLSSEDGWIDASVTSGLSDILESTSIEYGGLAGGDIDNDGDLDLYFAVNEIDATTNRTLLDPTLPNIIAENQGDGTFKMVPNSGGAEGTSSGRSHSVTLVDYDVDGFLDVFVSNLGNPSEEDHDEGHGHELPEKPYELFKNEGNDNNWVLIDLEGVASNRDAIGAKVYVTAGGVTQLRQQDGGMHNRSQNDKRLHLGLGSHETIEEILVKWPSGQESRITDIAANQLIKITEESGDFTPGKPTLPDNTRGVSLWQETFDGSYRLEVDGGGQTTNFEITLMSTEPLLEVTPFSLEGLDSLSTTDFGFTLNATARNWTDGVDFRIAPGAKVLFSVTQDGIANPRQLYVGGEGSRLSPVGHILDSDQLPERPNFQPGEDLGLFVGKTATNSPDSLEFHWNGDGNKHRVDLTVLTSDGEANYSESDFENGDFLTPFSNGVEIESLTRGGVDELNVSIPEPTKIGFAYQQDDLYQSHRINPHTDELLGDFNAYWLPRLTIYGQPDYDPTREDGLFLWKEENDGPYKLRVTGDADGSLYTGSIVSDQPIENVNGFSLEGIDNVTLSEDQKTLNFELQVWQNWQDGFEFDLALGSSSSLNLDGQDSQSLVYIGEHKSPIAALPLDLSGW